MIRNLTITVAPLPLVLMDTFIFQSATGVEQTIMVWDMYPIGIPSIPAEMDRMYMQTCWGIFLELMSTAAHLTAYHQTIRLSINPEKMKFMLMALETLTVFPSIWAEHTN